MNVVKYFGSSGIQGSGHSRHSRYGLCFFAVVCVCRHHDYVHSIINNKTYSCRHVKACAMCVCVCWLRCHSIQVYRHVCCRFKFRDNEWRWMVVTLVSMNVYVRFCQFHRIASLNLYTRGYLFLGVEWRSERWSEWKPLRIAININIACYWYSVVVMQAEAHSPKQTCKRAYVCPDLTQVYDINLVCSCENVATAFLASELYVYFPSRFIHIYVLW